ncbi:MAG: hypothetical protein OEM89_06335 [Nitrosopumilus sp.]|nr:hypothetical protein [Nitrosopumilus sp.]
MKTRTILGISLAAAFAISISMTAAMADIPGSLAIVTASSDGTSHSMDVEDKVKQIPAHKADDTITFWAWVLQTPNDAPEGTVLAVDAITIHHKVNDHQAFGKDLQSKPVQGFHPHKAFFDENFCVIGLKSPHSAFKVQHNTLVMTSSQTEAVAAATGTIGGDGHEACPFGLGITGLSPITSIP